MYFHFFSLYNAYDFIRNKPLERLPKSLEKLDFYIGEEEYLRRGIGSKILNAFDYQGFDYILVDPDINNTAAIKTYENAEFEKIKEHLDTNEVWMIREILKVLCIKNAQHYKLIKSRC